MKSSRALIAEEQLLRKGRLPLPKRMNFRKSSKRGGGHFQSKNLYCKIWTFKQVYVTMKLIQSVARLKKLQYNFPKMRGGGSKAVWNFSENSSILEEKGVPYIAGIYELHKFGPKGHFCF